jgi:probable rRNA maturation factor
MGTVEIVIARPAWRRLAPRCSRLLGRLLRAMRRTGCGVTLRLATDAEVRRLNRAFLGKDRATDVLSFPSPGELEPGSRHLGDIAVSVPLAGRQARRAGWTLGEELSLLVTHGFLHLLGYDHEEDDGEMRRLEESLLARAGRVSLKRRRRPWGEVPGGAAGGPVA